MRRQCEKVEPAYYSENDSCVKETDMQKEILSRRLGRVAAELRSIMTPAAYDALARKATPVDAKFEDLTNEERIAVRRAEAMHDKINGTRYGA